MGLVVRDLLVNTYTILAFVPHLTAFFELLVPVSICRLPFAVK